MLINFLSKIVVLRTILPLVIGLLSLIATTTSYFATRATILQATEESVTQNLRSTLSKDQGNLEQLTGTTKELVSRQLIGAYRSIPDTVFATLVDENGIIRFSTLPDEVGKTWNSLTPGINAEKLNQAISQRNIVINVPPHKEFIDGYVSVCEPDTINTGNKICGFFAHRIDLNYHNEKATTGLFKQALYTGLSMVLIALIIGLILHYCYIKRATKLASQVTAFANGKRHIQTEISGLDEISNIARSVDYLFEHIENNENTIYREKNRLNMLFDTVSDPIIVTRNGSEIVGVNKATQNTFGYSQEELLGKDLFDMMPDIFIAGKKTHKDIFERFINKPYMELMAKRKGGEFFPIEFIINEMDFAGDLERIVIARDITERKAAEKELRQHRDNLQGLVAQATAEIKALVGTAISGVISINQDGIISLFNPAAEKLFGWKAEEIIGQNVAIIVPGINIETHNGFIKRYIETRQAHIVGIGREVEALRKDGSTFPAQLSVGHKELGNGKHLFVGFVDDITARKASEKELLQAKETAEEAAKMKASFLANMSHEIRTPMNAVIGFSEILLQDPELSEESRQHAGTILSSGRNLLHIINDILDFSKIEAGQITLENVCFHLPNSIQDTLRTLEFKAEEKNISLTYDVDPRLPVRVIGDPSRLRQIIINLVGNAIKFTHSGTVTVNVKPQDDTDMILFSVSDTGIGMTPEQIKKVFEAFSQADSSTNRKFGGTGLGTTISKQIVELMGGKIWVESVLGEGTNFYFTANFKEANDYDECLFENGVFTQENYHSPRIFNVLMAEDIPANAKLARLRLEQQGHSVTWVENGEKALEEALTGKYDLVLMDIQMPQMDGLTATTVFRDRAVGKLSELPIIALTASVMREDRQHCFDAGMNAVVGKPINFSELLSTMESVVPAGEGEVNETGYRLILKQPTSINFSVLGNVINHEKGLTAWNDAKIYANALLDFAKEHSQDGIQLLKEIENHPDDLEVARTIAHALKGLAGNLCATKVANSASKVDALLKDGNTKRARKEAIELNKLLEITANEIAKLEVHKETETNQINENVDQLVILKTLGQLVDTLDELNPETVMPHMKELEQYINRSELTGIQSAIDNFDFESAKQAALELAKNLHA